MTFKHAAKCLVPIQDKRTIRYGWTSSVPTVLSSQQTSSSNRRGQGCPDKALSELSLLHNRCCHVELVHVDHDGDKCEELNEREDPERHRV